MAKYMGNSRLELAFFEWWQMFDRDILEGRITLGEPNDLYTLAVTAAFEAGAYAIYREVHDALSLVTTSESKSV